MGNRFLHALCLVGLFSMWVPFARAAGISVEPSYVKITDIVPGGPGRLTKAAGYVLKFENKREVGETYTISFHSCKELGMKPNGGYAELPELNWFVFRSTEIIVPERSSAYLNYLEISVPEKAEFLNKKWQVLVKVARKTKDALAVEVIVPLWLETRMQKKSDKKPGDSK